MKKIAFFHFPKAAGSFLLNYINEFLNDYFYNAKHHKYTDIKEKINSLYKIAFVRNPFAWYVSRYFYFAREVSRVEGGISIQCDSGLWGKEFTDKFPMPEHHILWGLKEVPNFSFTYRFNEMFLDENGKNRIDFIGKTETLYEGFEMALKNQNIPLPAISLKDYYEIHKNNQSHTNSTIHEHYTRYHTPKTIKLIKHFDAGILKKYNYSF